MSLVSITSCPDYSPEHCKQALETVLGPLGGLEWVQPGMKIAIKANLVSAMKPEKAATTHPALLAELTRMLRDRGAQVIIGDSPGGVYNAAFLNRVYASTGMQEAQAAGAVLNQDFGQVEAAFPEAYVAKHFTYTSYLAQADAIISFCKLKSHGMMSLSAATKNLFGAIPGTMKPEYHFRYPDPMDFAGMLIDLNRYLKPRLYIVDAVVAMEGNGPTAGTPRQMGALLAGADCHALDMICCQLIGLDPMAVPTLQVAVQRGLVDPEPGRIPAAGEVASFIVPDFQRIEGRRSLQFASVLPGKLGTAFSKVASAALRPSPRLKKPECVGCGLCQSICPAKAITITPDKKAQIDKQKCIRCFCCQEFCPKGAMKVHRPWIARILNQ